MSDKLVVLNNNPLAIGGIGYGTGLFKVKPSTIEIVPKSTRQVGAIPGTFRNMTTNERLGVMDEQGNITSDEIRVVLLAVPQEQREYYLNDGKTFSKEQKLCFSLDNIEPSKYAKEPPAMFCSKCPMGDINWEKWRETKSPKDLPPCQMYWHLRIAERNTQTVYYLNVKGISIAPFKNAMQTQMAGLLQRMASNTVQLNRAKGWKFNKNTGTFEQIDPEAKELTAPVPLPNIFDISFTIFSDHSTADIKMGFKDFTLMKPEDRAEFGALYVEALNAKAEREAAREQDEAQSEEQQGNNEVVDAEYIDTPPVPGTKDAPISI